ncbi:hypothetical protein EVAR_19332_1 [Eumeta japonica]|uniref:Uncharacterized protein n=1 Tax=Eumeta variegata TaxID=151549 RepID=A0A4C1TRB3_EUMVA|nr:hypothetical protein EVAR_19332_1 [Eumeta japonica]
MGIPRWKQSDEQYNAQNFAAVKFVTKASQWSKIETRRRRKGTGERNTCAVYRSQPIQSGKVSCVVLYTAGPPPILI